MSEERAIVKDFDENTRDYWLTHADYDRVTALLLYWKEDDLKVEPEVLKLKHLFEDEFLFATSMFLIPSKNSTAELQYTLASFIKQHSLSERHLTIVYYAGHSADVDDTTPAGYSEWRAKEEDGPTVNWFQLQPILYAAQGDVFTLLDCCHAAIKTRGSKTGKMEILAACASGSRVPAPGRLSFTSVFIREVRKRLQRKQDISIRWIHRHLWDDATHPSLTQTPVYFDLSKNDMRSIILRPLLPKPPEGFARKLTPPSSFVMLTVSLADDPTGLQIENWLKSFLPNILHGVAIEALVLKARRLEGLRKQDASFTGSILGKISPSAQAEVLQRIWSLSQVVASATSLAVEAATAKNLNSIQLTSDKNLAARCIDDLKSTVSAACDSIEGSLLLDPNIELEEAAKDDVAKEVGAIQAITLRQYLLDASKIPDTPELPKSVVKFNSLLPGDRKRRFRFGSIAEKSVVVESLHYELFDDFPDPAINFVNQIKKMVAQLSLPKRTSASILPCVGYIHDRTFNQFCIVFEADAGSNLDELPITLTSFYSSTKRVPLGSRIHLAHVLAVAVENLHRVGWIHKEIKPDNAVFFKSMSAQEHKEIPNSRIFSEMAVDFSRPWLFGFEYSRSQDDATSLAADYSLKSNAYRHPDRWGRPTMRFEKSHDVYALGVILLEIALWKPVKDLPEMKIERIDPWIFKASLINKAKKDLPHMVGQNFADAVTTCLQFNELTSNFDELKMHTFFKDEIMEKLEAGISKV